MNPCKKYRKRFTDALYQTQGDKQQQQLNEHLGACGACQREFEQMRHTLSIMDQRQRPEPESHVMDGLWDQIAPRLISDAPAQKSRMKLWPWLSPVAAAALLIIGFMLGKSANPLNDHRGAQIAHQGKGPVTPVSLASQTQRYIEQSKLVLLGFVNFDPQKEDIITLNMAQRRQMSEELVQKAAFLKDKMDSSAENRLERLIDELQMILLQIANLDQENNLDAIEIVRSGIERKGVLFKIEVEEMNADEWHPEKNNRTI